MDTVETLQAEIAQLRQQLIACREKKRDLEISLELTTEHADDYERELRQRNVELDAFARTVAHDLKTPLCGIINMAEVLLYSCTLDKPMDSASRERLHLLEGSAQQMFHIIEDLLLLAGVSQHDEQQVEIKPLDMAYIVNDVLTNRLSLMLLDYQAQVKVAPEFPTVLGYAPWVKGVWVNYLTNACKYGGSPPQIKIGVDTLPIANKIRFWVQDNGAGLTAEMQEQVFKPFKRAHDSKIEGHGVGLSIVAQIIEKLGGEVGVESQVEQGSLFYFSLPCVAEGSNQ